jgi:hypothetical protein
VRYEDAVEAFKRGLGNTLLDAPRGNDTAEIDGNIAKLQRGLDVGEERVSRLVELTISDRNSGAAGRALQKAEQELERVRNELRKLEERRDTLTTTNVKMRLAAVEKAFAAEPMDIEAANKALRGAVRRMIMRPQEGRLDILWHHADEPQDVTFITSRFDWDANQLEATTE